MRPCKHCNGTVFVIHTIEANQYACEGLDEDGSPIYWNALPLKVEVKERWVRCKSCLWLYDFTEDE